MVKRTYFMTVIDGVFCLDACAVYKSRDAISCHAYKWSEIIITIWTLITLLALHGVSQKDPFSS